ncbi:MAG TPA: prolyl oligopeptidase family serine peptidase, partial [Flavobacteriaceae bacterium]|nr:prolyl oligopeptidase family serine peptidase [Flavobacteriaceae bacterium]
SPNIPEAQLNAEIKTMSYPWMKFFLKYDPRPALEKIKVPVLAINGGNDLQVPAEINLNAIETALKKGGNNQVTIKILPGLNHLFQKSETGLPSEYRKLEQKFSAETMELISDWIKSLE